MAVATTEWAPPLKDQRSLTEWCPIIVIDSQPLIRAGLVSLIHNTLGSQSVCFSGSTVREGIEAGLRFPGAIVVLGTRRDDPPGQEIEAITAFAMNNISVIVLVDNPSIPSYEAALLAGAKGYVDKEASPAEFIGALKMLSAGHACPPAARVYRDNRVDAQVHLSEQERRALVLYASGLTLDMVARRMNIAPNTVKHYLDRVRDKYSSIGVRARTKLELHALARTEGLLP